MGAIMIFRTIECNERFAKITYEDISAKEAFASFAREEYPQSHYFNDPERFWCSVGIFNSIMTGREQVKFTFAGIEEPRSNPATRRLLRKLYRFYKTQGGEEAKFIKSCLRRLRSKNMLLP